MGMFGVVLTHGQYSGGVATPTISTYVSVMRRCYDENADQFLFYGGRGIQVCDSWRYDFMNFLRDMGDRPKGKFLDRIDNDGDYTPENCQWATHQKNCRNRRSTRWVVVDGQRYTFKEFAERFCTVKRQALHNRLAQGWTMEEITRRYLKPEHGEVQIESLDQK